MNITLDTCVEVFGVIAALVYVYLEIEQRWSMWAVGIVSSLVYVYVFYVSKFYADMGLSAYYALASVYGMWCWRPGMAKADAPTKPALQVSRITTQQVMLFAAITAVLFVVMRYILITYTAEPASPTGDAFTTALGIMGTYMLARKILEHWLVWIVANGIATGLYFYKNLHPTAVLYLIYTLLSFYGFWRWRKQMALNS